MFIDKFDYIIRVRSTDDSSLWLRIEGLWSAEHHITSLQLSFGHRHLKTLKINQNARNIHICLSLGFCISNAFSRFKNNTYRWFELFYKSFDFLPWQPRFFLSCLL